MSPQSWNPTEYDLNARFVSDLGAGVVEWLDPKPGERILDIGCGDGVLTNKIKALGCSLVGVDSSPDFIQAAQKLGLDARLMDAKDLHFNAEFDAVFSNAALHWMKQLDQVLAGVFRALKPGGRFVGEMGGKGNIDQIEMATLKALARRSLTGVVPHPNFYPSEKQFQSLLENQGFKVSVLNLFDRPTPLPGDLKAWLRTFRKSYLELLDPQDLPVFLEEIQESLRSRLCNPQGQWVADYVRLRFSAFKPL